MKDPKQLIAALLMMADEYADEGELVSWTDAEVLESWLPLIKHASREHSGDCKREPWACLRCQADEYLERADALLK